MMAHPRFVVQEHQASTHHYDFRLEMGGVLKSWAVPKGPSMNPADKRLAIQVPDHNLKHFNYQGIIPEDSYGAGPVIKWDSGTYQALEDKSPTTQLKAGHIHFKLKGKKLKGEFSLIKLKGRAKQWLLIKVKDPHADPKWKIKKELTQAKIKTLKVKTPPCS